MSDARRRRTSGAFQEVRLVGEVTAGPGGAMTRDGGTLTGELTVSTTSSRGGRAHVEVRAAGSEEWHPLAGSPFPVPPEGVEALHELVLGAIGAGAPDRPAD